MRQIVSLGLSQILSLKNPREVKLCKQKYRKIELKRFFFFFLIYAQRDVFFYFPRFLLYIHILYVTWDFEYSHSLSLSFNFYVNSGL